MRAPRGRVDGSEAERLATRLVSSAMKARPSSLWNSSRCPTAMASTTKRFSAASISISRTGPPGSPLPSHVRTGCDADFEGVLRRQSTKGGTAPQPIGLAHRPKVNEGGVSAVSGRPWLINPVTRSHRKNGDSSDSACATAHVRLTCARLVLTVNDSDAKPRLRGPSHPASQFQVIDVLEDQDQAPRLLARPEST